MQQLLVHIQGWFAKYADRKNVSKTLVSNMPIAHGSIKIRFTN